MGLCEWCGVNPTKDQRRRFCSYTCSAKYRVATSPNLGSKPKVSQEEFQQAITLVNLGSSWDKAAQSIGLSESGLRVRATREQTYVRRGQQAIRSPQRFVPLIDIPGISRLATLIDTEGHITIGSETANRTKVILIGITNTHEPTIRWLEQMGGRATRKKGNRLGRLPCWTWQLQARLDVVALLETVIPYMHMKREKAERALTLLRQWIAPHGML